MPASCLLKVIQPIMEHALHVFGNAGGQADMPVRCSDVNTAAFQICGVVLDAKLQLKVYSSPCFTWSSRALREEGGMSSGPRAPFDLCRMAQSGLDGWNGWQQATSTVGLWGMWVRYHPWKKPRQVWSFFVLVLEIKMRKQYLPWNLLLKNTYTITERFHPKLVGRLKK